MTPDIGGATGAAVGAVFGAIIGSFLATLILRWPNGRGILRGRSQCDGCGRTLAPYELVPILSALILRSKCRTCAAPIASTHLVVEICCATIGAIALFLAPTLEGAGWAILLWLLLTLAILDWRHLWLPDAIVLPLAFLGFTLAMWVTNVAMPDRIIGALAGYLSLLALSLGYRALRKQEGLGLGDAKLLGALGAWFGWQALPFMLLAASMTALIGVAGMAIGGRALSRTSAIPLGTFLCAAALPGWLLTLMLLG